MRSKPILRNFSSELEDYADNVIGFRPKDK